MIRISALVAVLVAVLVVVAGFGFVLGFEMLLRSHGYR